MSIKTELARLRDKARSFREARENVCTCARTIIIEGEATPEQQVALAALKPCKVHPTVIAVVEVASAPDFLRARDIQQALELEN